MQIALMAVTGLAAFVALVSIGAEQQPSITQILATVPQLGDGWTSNRVVVLVDPLSSPSEMADKNENPEAWLRFVHDLLRKQPRREAHAIVRYYGGRTNLYHTNSLVHIMRWKSKEDIGLNWGLDKETKDSPGTLPKVGEEVRFSQRQGMHNNITFRRGNYLIDVECATAYGVEHLKRLAEVLDSNFLKAQKALATKDHDPATQK